MFNLTLGDTSSYDQVLITRMRFLDSSELSLINIICYSKGFTFVYLLFSFCMKVILQVMPVILEQI